MVTLEGLKANSPDGMCLGVCVLTTIRKGNHIHNEIFGLKLTMSVLLFVKIPNY